MRFDIPKATRSLDLAEYQPEWAGQAIQVWVNPPREKIEEHYGQLQGALDGQRAITAATEAMADPASGPEDIEQAKADAGRGMQILNDAGERIMTWMAEMWSQDPDQETHWSVEEIRILVDQTISTDPQLWPWLCQRTREMQAEYRQRQKKALTVR